MQSDSCAECLKLMARSKSEILARIACANCHQAEADLSQVTKTVRDLSCQTVLGVRCLHCGKWCLTKSALATHQRRHVISIR
jgi:hypothetical protein